MIGYPGFLAWSGKIKDHFFGIPYNISFIDEACSVKMAGYWPSSFFCELMDRDESVELNFIFVRQRQSNETKPVILSGAISKINEKCPLSQPMSIF